MKVNLVEHLTGVVGELDRVDGVHFEPQDLEKGKHTLVEASTFSAVSAGILSQQSWCRIKHLSKSLFDKTSINPAGL